MGAVLGMSMMSAFNYGRGKRSAAGIPGAGNVHVGRNGNGLPRFREKGFFTASSVHGPTALFGGYLRTMEFMGSNLTEMFQHTYEEIRNGEFERKFEAERKAGYPALKMAEAYQSEENPQGQAEVRLRALLAGQSSRT